MTARPPLPELRGVILCRVGEHRLAFSALDITSVERVAETDGRYMDARAAFHSQAGQGRALLGDLGASVVVDTMEIHQEGLSMMAVPGILQTSLGESLFGFVTLKDQLWPV